MNTLRLLIVEDDDQDLQVCKDSLKTYNIQKQQNVKLTECRSVEKALKELQQLNNQFDGAIIDLKLADEGGEGNQVIKVIEESCFRIPIAILTATPVSANREFTYIGVFKKGEVEYHDLFDHFLDIQMTGLTHIMGGRRLIEQTLNKVFLNNLLPQINTWVSYGKTYIDTDPKRTERALLRYTLNHLFELLEEDNELFFPEEVYLYPPATNKIKTGCIVKKDNQWYLVLSPACDLAIITQVATNEFLDMETPSLMENC